MECTTQRKAKYTRKVKYTYTDENIKFYFYAFSNNKTWVAKKWLKQLGIVAGKSVKIIEGIFDDAEHVIEVLKAMGKYF